jgi:hypothetical protein
MVKKNQKSGKAKNKIINEKKKHSNKKKNSGQPITEVGFQLVFHASEESKIPTYLESNSKNSSGNQSIQESKNICLNILYYDENLITSSENNEICSFFKLKNQGTFYGIHNFDLFKYICEKIKDSNKSFILISSGSSSEKIFNYISDINVKEFKAYYIYCYEKAKYLPLIKKYRKLKGVYNDYNDFKNQIFLIEGIKNEIKQSSNLIFWNDYNKIYIKLHYEIIRKYSLYKLLKSISNDESKFLQDAPKFLDLVNKKFPYYLDLAKQLLYHDENDMIDYFIKNTDEDEETIKNVFNGNHNIDNYISNYTLESFYYKYLNKFLREGNYKSFRTLSNHISKFIYHLYEYRKRTMNNHNQSNLYRKMYLTPEDFNIYLNSIGRVICYPSFTSTSLVENNSFSPNPSNKDDQFVKLIIEQNNSKSVVSISEISQFPKEKEYLFLPFSFFKVQHIEQRFGNRNDPHLIYLVALDSEKPIEDMLLDFMENETDNLDPEGLDFFLLINNDTKIILNQQLISKF